MSIGLNVARKVIRLSLYICISALSCYVNIANAGEQVKIANQESAQFVISSESTPSVHIDIIDSSYLTHTLNEDDILLVTHFHPDHYEKGFCDDFPGRKLIVEKGVIDFQNGMVRSIPSSHTGEPEDKLMDKGGSNYIQLVEIQGLRIAHFGDIGQNAFTQEQMALLGRVDIAITQFVNPLSDMSLENMKAFRLMESLSPSIIIPTSHGRFNSEVILQAQTKWQVFASEESVLAFAQEKLPTATTFLVWGDGASFVQEDFSLAKWPIQNQE